MPTLMSRFVENICGGLILGYFFLILPTILYPECDFLSTFAAVATKLECKNSPQPYLNCLLANVTLDNFQRVAALRLGAQDSFFTWMFVEWRDYAFILHDRVQHMLATLINGFLIYWNSN